VRTNAERKDLPVVPVLLIDGWPGSFYGFYKMLDSLNQNFKDISLDIFVPSMPGYLYSTPLNRPIDPVDTAFLFDALVRFHHGEDCKYYAHGEDWGSVVTSNLAQLFPNRVKGIHLTMSVLPDQVDIIATFYSILGPLFPSYFYSPDELEHGFDKDYTLANRALVFIKDLGYMHLQATWPDSVSHG
jgi:pimeloyl-ACP methyl ester carboxylesterase